MQTTISRGFSPQAADNDNEVELLDRLRGAALGTGGAEKSRRSAQLVFDPTVELEKRMRHIAGLSGPESLERRASKVTLARRVA